MKNFVFGFLLFVVALALAALSASEFTAGDPPSNDRDWMVPQARMPAIEFDGDSVRIRDIRDFVYHSADDFTPRYHDATYPLDELETVWFILSPFEREWRGPAHTFLSFGFRDGRYLGISVEARREVGEEYSILKGALGRFELMYVVAEERDLIGLRAVTWEDPVYVYPIRATPEQVRQVFVHLLERAEHLRRTPRYYNTFTDNCTTNILDAVNRVASEPISFGWEILFPGFSDRIAHERGLIDTELSLDGARRRFEVNDRARAAIGADDFSERIRG